MDDESGNLKSPHRLIAVRPSPAVEEEARMLVDALLDQTITASQRHRFEQLVVDDPKVAELYLEIVHLWYYVPLHLPNSAHDLSALKSANQRSMDEAVILPAIHEGDVGEEDAPITLPKAPAVPQTPNLKGWWIGSAAAMLIVGVALLWMMRADRENLASNPGNDVPFARVTAVATTNPSTAFSPGVVVAAGKTGQLASGTIELTFSSGTVAIIQGPAQFRVIDRNTFALNDGAMTAHVPVAARGFHVLSPGFSLIDRGTNFGVRTLANRTGSDVQIFEGQVDVAGTDLQGLETSTLIHAVAGNAFRHETTTGAAPTAVAYEPQSFNRDITAVRAPIPLHDTGQNAADDTVDPDWQIVSVPNNLAWEPRSARVVSKLTALYTRYVRTGKWIGINEIADPQPAGDFVFRTTVDLSQFDPDSVHVSATITADDFISDILINGVHSGISTAGGTYKDGAREQLVTLPTGNWHKGLNQVEFVVHNDKDLMLLHVRWDATACLLVQR